MLMNFGVPLVDLNIANEVEPHDAFTLSTCSLVKLMLKDYEGALIE